MLLYSTACIEQGVSQKNVLLVLQWPYLPTLAVSLYVRVATLYLCTIFQPFEGPSIAFISNN